MDDLRKILKGAIKGLEHNREETYRIYQYDTKNMPASVLEQFCEQEGRLTGIKACLMSLDYFLNKKAV